VEGEEERGKASGRTPGLPRDPDEEAVVAQIQPPEPGS
jgi:hypothetical protein